MTLLHVAAEDNIDAVKYLVKKGANKNIRNQSRVSIGDFCVEWRSSNTSWHISVHQT